MSAQSLQPARQSLSAIRLLHLYVWAVMALLFVQGTGSLFLRLRPDIDQALQAGGVVLWAVATINNGNIPHAILHIAWGTFGLFVLAFLRMDRVRLTLAWVFGTFYTLLGFLGIIVTNPFGLRLGWEENVFHLVIGPVMLVLAWLATSRPGTNEYAKLNTKH